MRPIDLPNGQPAAAMQAGAERAKATGELIDEHQAMSLIRIWEG